MEVKDNETKKSSPWIECESKKIPGQKYLFNKITGESKWLSPTKNKTNSAPIEVKKELRTPANERLKRLQRDLQKPRTLDQKTKDTNNEIKTSQKNVTTKLTTEKLKSKISTSPNKKSGKSTLTPKKRLTEKVENAEKLNLNKKLENKSQKDLIQNKNDVIVKKVPKANESVASKSQKRNETTKTSNEDKEKSLHKNSININKRYKIPKKLEKTKNIFNKIIKTDVNEIKSQKVVKEVKEIKDANVNKKSIEKTEIAIEITTSEDELQTPKKSIVLTSSEDEVITQKNAFVMSSSEDELGTTKKLCLENQLKKTKMESSSSNEEKTKAVNCLQLTNPAADKSTTSSSPSQFSFPSIKFLANCISTPISHIKRKANERLGRFRQSLQKENITKSTSLDQNSNTLTSPDNTTEYEEMDWEPSTETPANSSLPEQIEMEVDENLMLNAAEKNDETLQSIKEKWLKYHLYIVLDTNIFIHHLDYIEKLKTYKPTDAAGIILYLPYSVLQELDKLKLRENIQFQVIRAIKYLNKVFETKDLRVQAQNALENCNRLIEVESCDDNILNACLQVREHIQKLILFTEDVNLRNKAMCNDIQVATKKDFLKKFS